MLPNTDNHRNTTFTMCLKFSNFEFLEALEIFYSLKNKR